MTNIRVSCASLARITLDDKFLLGLNHDKLRRKGISVFTPYGGVLAFYEPARPLLAFLGAIFEKAGSDDLRLTLPEENLPAFETWFSARTHRESDPYRELVEEFVEEEGILPDLRRTNVTLDYLTTATERVPTNKPGQEGVLTQRYLEIYNTKFIPEYEQLIREDLSQPDTHLGLLTERELRTGRSDTGIEIGTNCLPLIVRGEQYG